MARLIFLGALALVLVWGGLAFFPSDMPATDRKTSSLLHGPVRVVDGDTIDVGGVRVRLHGIDAPEIAQTCTTSDGNAWACGEWVRTQLEKHIQGKLATCEDHGFDRYGRLIGTCQVDGRDVAQYLVREGMAFAYRRYSRDYIGVEKEAAEAARGLWTSDMVSPEDFRRALVRD